MITIWEALQGLAFMASFGALTRMAFGKDTTAKAPSAPRSAPQAIGVPLPRSTPEEEHGSLPIG